MSAKAQNMRNGSKYIMINVYVGVSTGKDMFEGNVSSSSSQQVAKILSLKCHGLVERWNS